MLSAVVSPISIPRECAVARIETNLPAIFIRNFEKRVFLSGEWFFPIAEIKYARSVGEYRFSLFERRIAIGVEKYFRRADFSLDENNSSTNFASSSDGTLEKCRKLSL